MSRSLDDLSSDLRPKVFELLARLVEHGVAVMIVQTLRTPAEASANLANGTSKTLSSKHLPRRNRVLPASFTQLPEDVGKCDAIDICPYAQYDLHGPDKLQWDTKDPAWSSIGEEAEKLDLRWGGRWFTPHDPGHIELVISDHDRQLVILERQRP